jgi:hypothetical protein
MFILWLFSCRPLVKTQDNQSKNNDSEKATPTIFPKFLQKYAVKIQRTENLIFGRTSIKSILCGSQNNTFKIM